MEKSSIKKKGGYANCGTPHDATPENKREVELLCYFGVSHLRIAEHLDIDEKTLYKHYRAELDNAKSNKDVQVGKFLFQNASGMTLAQGATHSDCIRAAMFWAKTQMGWREGEEPVKEGNIVNNYYLHPNAQ